MRELAHEFATLAAFDILRKLSPDRYISVHAAVVANEAARVDDRLDLEFVNVEGGLFDHGRDDPHSDDWFAVEDIAHVSEPKPGTSKGDSLTTFNHFIDIRKGPGLFDDFDGYSYWRGSGSVDERQFLWDAGENPLETLIGISIPGVKVGAGVSWYFEDEYVHAPGQRWYKGCSPSVECYSYVGDLKRYPDTASESQARFPLAAARGRPREGGIPWSVFMPLDNMARYWYQRFNERLHPQYFGPVMHALQDASIPHHAAGCLGNWHGKYEAIIERKILDWLRDPALISGAESLAREWLANRAQSPGDIGARDWDKNPSPAWTIEQLVTWMAVVSYHDYEDPGIYNGFRNEYSLRFNEESAKQLTQKALALCALVLASTPAMPKRTLDGPRIIALDKFREIVVLENTSPNIANMTGWKLKSTIGKQTYSFPRNFALCPGEAVAVTSGPRATTDGIATLLWTRRFVWNNLADDRAQLYNPEGHLVNEMRSTEFPAGVVPA